MLSIDEVVEYFGDSGQLAEGYTNNGQLSDQYDSNRIAYDYYGTPNLWWLRSPGNSYNLASVVNADGSIDCSGYQVSSTIGIRPALWLYAN